MIFPRKIRGGDRAPLETSIHGSTTSWDCSVGSQLSCLILIALKHCQTKHDSCSILNEKNALKHSNPLTGTRQVEVPDLMKCSRAWLSRKFAGIIINLTVITLNPLFSRHMTQRQPLLSLRSAQAPTRTANSYLRRGGHHWRRTSHPFWRAWWWLSSNGKLVQLLTTKEGGEIITFLGGDYYRDIQLWITTSWELTAFLGGKLLVYRIVNHHYCEGRFNGDCGGYQIVDYSSNQNLNQHWTLVYHCWLVSSDEILQ